MTAYRIVLISATILIIFFGNKSVLTAAVDREAAQAERGVVSNVLSFMGMNTTKTELSSDSEENDTEAPSSNEIQLANAEDKQVTKTKADRGRGPYRKKHHKHYYHHLWSVYYYYAWVFAFIAVKFKLALLILWGHFTYFAVALIRVLIKEVWKSDMIPLWIQLKKDNGPPYGVSQYGYPYGNSPYGQTSYGQNSYGPYKRIHGSTNSNPSGAQELAYSPQNNKK